MLRGLLLFILLFLTTAVPVRAASPYGRFHALVIGIQNYQHLTPLKTPTADAKAVAELLKNQYGFTVQLLLNPDRDRLAEAVSDLRRTMTEEEDSLLIYYAGHGFLDETTGVDYWQPVNAQRHSDLYWIPTSRITDTLRAVQAKHVLVVADSCYSGSLLRDSGAQLPPGMSRDTFLQRMFQRRSRTALTSGGKEPVLDSGGSGHSVFAWVFLEMLRKNRNILEGDSLFDRIKRPVALKADQTPQYGDIRKAGQDVEQGDFVFVPKLLQGTKLIDKQENKKERHFSRRNSEADTTSAVEPNRPGQVSPQLAKEQKTVTAAVPKLIDAITFQYHSDIKATASGGGTWGAILKLSVQIEGSTAKFKIISKKGPFYNTNSVSIRSGSHTGTILASGKITPGSEAARLHLNLETVSAFPHRFYATITNDYGKAWVGYVQITRNNHVQPGSTGSLHHEKPTGAAENTKIVSLVFFVVLLASSLLLKKIIDLFLLKKQVNFRKKQPKKADKYKNT